MTHWFRRNIGAIISVIGLILLVILTFGDMGELFTDEYWKNVGGNISSISALTIGLVLVQVAIKQGVGEQALSAGLNTPETKKKYEEHKEIMAKNREKSIYMPYFLGIRNERETKRRKREFLNENNFTSEEKLRLSKNKKLIRAYDKIRTNVTVDSIKWSTTEIHYNKNGSIEKLDTYRAKRTIRAVISAFVMMFATTLIAGGLILDTADIPFWQKCVKFITYLIPICILVVFDIGANYEKGAFGVPNELDEINGIWKEFENWEIPQWVIDEVAREAELGERQKLDNDGIEKGENDEVEIRRFDARADIQEKSEESENI